MKPREFWCDITDEYDKGKCLVMECHIEKPPEWEKTHRVSEGLSINVIEKSAYDELLAHVKESHPNNFRGYVAMEKQIKELQDKLRLAIEALENINEEIGDSERRDVPIIRKIVKDTLKLITEISTGAKDE